MIQFFKRKVQAFNANKELMKFAAQINSGATGKSPEELFDYITGPICNRFFWIKQIKQEFVPLVLKLKSLDPKFLLEIGTANGGSLFMFCKLANPNAHIISIDLPNGEFGGGYPVFRSSFYRTFPLSGQKLSLLRANSQNKETIKHLQDILGGSQLDFLFIDGDHSYNGVKADFDNYAPLVRKGGIIAFHDIAEHPSDWNVGVRNYWNEIKSNFIYEEYIYKPDQGWAGIGILIKT